MLHIILQKLFYLPFFSFSFSKEKVFLRPFLHIYYNETRTQANVVVVVHVAVVEVGVSRVVSIVKRGRPVVVAKAQKNFPTATPRILFIAQLLTIPNNLVKQPLALY